MAVDVVFSKSFSVISPDEDGYCISTGDRPGAVYGTASFKYVRYLLSTKGVTIPEYDFLETPDNGLIDLIDPHAIGKAAADLLAELFTTKNPVIDGQVLFETDNWEGETYVNRQWKQTIQILSAMCTFSAKGHHTVIKI